MHSIFKRLMALVLILAMALCVVACEEPEEDDGDSKPTSTRPSGSSLPTTPSDPGTSRPQLDSVLQETAYIIGDHEISAVMLNFFYIDSIINYCNQYSYYLSYILDINAPLNAPSNTDKDGKSWADKFLEMAIENMTVTYQLYDQAQKQNFQLTEEQKTSIDSIMTNLETYSKYYGFANADAYLIDTYGVGANTAAFRRYCEISTLADVYYTAYADALEFDDAALRAYEADKHWQYNSYSYAYYYVNASFFLSNTTNPSAAEKAAAVAKAKAVAEQIAAGQYTTAAEFDAAITQVMQANTGNSNQQYSAVAEKDVLYSKLRTLFAPWLSGEDAQIRQEGDLTLIANESGSGENKTINGYYVLRFENVNENKFLLKNVRHLLVKFEGNTDAAKAAAKKAAMDLLAEFENSDRSEETFAKMANEHSDDGNGTTGGLYEDIFPGQMVEPFEQWCYEEGRQTGDYGLVETQYGWHIMYFVGNSENTYRDFMVGNDLRTEELKSWVENLVESSKTELVTTAHVNMTLKIKDL